MTLIIQDTLEDINNNHSKTSIHQITLSTPLKEAIIKVGDKAFIHKIKDTTSSNHNLNHNLSHNLNHNLNHFIINKISINSLTNSNSRRLSSQNLLTINGMDGTHLSSPRKSTISTKYKMLQLDQLWKLMLRNGLQALPLPQHLLHLKFLKRRHLLIHWQSVSN